MCGGEEKKKKRNDTSLRDLQLTGGRNSLEQEANLVYAIRATRGYRNPNFLSKLQKVRVSPTLVISCLVAMWDHILGASGTPEDDAPSRP